jgi:hypothetical protein
MPWKEINVKILAQTWNLVNQINPIKGIAPTFRDDCSYLEASAGHINIIKEKARIASIFMDDCSYLEAIWPYLTI